MAHEVLPIRAFLTTFGKWLHAIEQEQADDANFFVDQLQAVGMMLAVDPEFMRIFASNRRKCRAPEAEDALYCLNAFLTAVTDASRKGRYRDRGNNNNHNNH